MKIPVRLEDGTTVALKLTPKRESWIHRAIAWLPFIPDTYMTRYWTVVGGHVAVPESATYDMGSPRWVDRYKEVLRHEARHARNWKRYTPPIFLTYYLGPSVTLGLPSCLVALVLGFLGLGWGWSIGALSATLALLPLSVGLAYGRFLEEVWAFRESIERVGPSRAKDVVDMLWEDYAWTWPRVWAREYIRREFGV